MSLEEFEPGLAQQQVLASTSPALVVLGGAGTGKTTVAAAVVRDALDAAKAGRPKRALFLSFSRSAVTQVLDRTRFILSDHTSDVEVTTFHAFAWKIITRWGSAVGLADPELFSPSEQKVFGATNGLTYRDLIPLASEIVTTTPAVANHFADRWSVIVCDEFQDTTDDQYELLLQVRGGARLILLGDLNQCIYANFPDSFGVGPARIDAALQLPGAQLIELPDSSYRDTSNVLPRAATQVRLRRFEASEVNAAIASGALKVLRERTESDEASSVASLVEALKADEGTVAIFSHHHDMTASLSDGLTQVGVAHEIVGLPEAVDAALRAQFEVLRLASGQGTPDDVSRMLAVFVASVERGSRAPALALMFAGRAQMPAGLKQLLASLVATVEQSGNPTSALDVAGQAHTTLGLTRGSKAWTSANAILRELLGARLNRASTFPPAGVEHLRESISEKHLALLSDDDPALAADVQLMGLYQSKGREADHTVVILRSSDFYGNEAEPMADGSKLLYVLLTRSRRTTTVLLVGRQLPGLVAPFELLAQDGRNPGPGF